MRFPSSASKAGMPSLAMVPLRRFRSNHVIDVLADLFIEHGPPEHIRSDNGPESVANAVWEWLAGSVSPRSIEPGSPGENGHIEGFDALCSTAKSFTGLS